MRWTPRGRGWVVVSGCVLAWVVGLGTGEPVSVGGRGRASAQPAGATYEAVRRAVATVLDRQREAWNAGDLDRFLVPYWQSEQLTFSSGGETRRGFKATQARYRQTYPDRKAMGRLAFSQLEVSQIAPGAVLALGNWSLEREAGPLGGNFTLVLRHIDGEWKIIHDHTSVRAATK
ncbi:MAG: YybH family protein [Planctomycetaceae bacterium]